MTRTTVHNIVAAFALFCASAAAFAAPEPTPSAPLPEGYKLLYSQPFDKADAMKDFQFSDPSAWAYGTLGKGTPEGKDTGGALELYLQSKYKTKVRSPFNIALIKDKVFGDFVLEADLVQTGKEYGHRDMCLFFGFTDVAKFYYVHIATKADPNAHNVFIVNEKDRKNFAKETTKGADWGLDKWHRVRLERDTKAGSIKVFFDNMTKPIMVAEDKTFLEGYVGFGSFDDTGKVDNVRIWGPEVKEKKGDIFPKAEAK